MRTLVFGRTGQVATELQRRGRPGMDIRAVGREEVDFVTPDHVYNVARTMPADVFVNAVAYTAVDKAETEEALAQVVNGASVDALARAAAERGIPLVHISTDYVFDGSGSGPWTPDAPTGPLGAYGRSKLMGEEAVRAAGGVHAILRTSWVFSAHGVNFVKTMLRLGAERDALDIVSDQTGAPTAAADIADAVLTIATALAGDASKTGTYHFAGAPDTGWDRFAREIFRQAGLAVRVSGIPTRNYPTPAQRPLNSRLDCSATETVFGISRPDWRASLGHVLQELSESGT